MNKAMILTSLIISMNATYSFASDIAFSESDLSNAQNIINNMLKAQNDKEIQSVSKQIQESSITAIKNGVENQFSGSTLDAFGIDKNALSAENPNMINNRLVMFVSSSMPLQTLRNYARDLSKVNGMMVIRGAQGGMKDYLKTRQWMWEVLKVNRDCKQANCATYSTEFAIDPVLFSLYEIKRVPALVYQPSMGISSYCDDITQAKTSKSIAFGDAYLGELIDSLIRQGENKVELMSLRKML